jgi:hypothetical protein
VRFFTMNGWRRVLGFHTDEYLHCAHREMVINAAREAGAAIFLQPVADLSHPGNLDYYTQILCYQAFTEKFPPNMIKPGLTPIASRKTGPKEMGTPLSAETLAAAILWWPTTTPILWLEVMGKSVSIPGVLPRRWWPPFPSKKPLLRVDLFTGTSQPQYHPHWFCDQ